MAMLYHKTERMRLFNRDQDADRLSEFKYNGTQADNREVGKLVRCLKDCESIPLTQDEVDCIEAFESDIKAGAIIHLDHLEKIIGFATNRRMNRPKISPERYDKPDGTALGDPWRLYWDEQARKKRVRSQIYRKSDIAKLEQDNAELRQIIADLRSHNSALVHLNQLLQGRLAHYEPVEFRDNVVLLRPLMNR